MAPQVQATLQNKRARSSGDLLQSDAPALKHRELAAVPPQAAPLLEPLLGEQT